MNKYIIITILFFLVSCNPTHPKDEFRIVKNGLGKHWVEKKVVFKFLGQKERWECVNPCIHFDGIEGAGEYLDEIIQARKKTVVRTHKAIEPRKFDESISDYLKRTGK